MSEEILKVVNLEGYYKGTFGVVQAVDGVTFNVNKGEILGIAGESGCGKSTLAELITGTPKPLLFHRKGQVFVNNEPIYIEKPEITGNRIINLKHFTGILKKIIDIIINEKNLIVIIRLLKNFIEFRIRKEPLKSKIRKQRKIVREEILCKVIGYVPQASLNSLNPVIKLKKIIRDVIEQRYGFKPRSFIRINGKIKNTYVFITKHLKNLGLNASILKKYPHELSGGMKQRAVVGISTLWNPSLLIADEPTSALDVTTQRLLINTFIDLQERKIVDTILFISHDIPTLAQVCNRCIIMYAGKIIEIGSMDNIIQNPLHPYTEELIHSIACFNPDGTAETRLKGIEGNPPNLRNPPRGCRFYPRCDKRLNVCKENYPPYYYPKGEINPVACWLYEK